MRKVNYEINQESIESMIEGKRFNPALEISFRDKTGKHRNIISAGHQDDIDVYREGAYTYVLSTNSHLGYVGLEVFKGSELVGEMFVESYNVKETLGREGLAPFNIIKRLKGYIL